jgi:translation initiation factor IF-2
MIMAKDRASLEKKKEGVREGAKPPQKKEPVVRVAAIPEPSRPATPPEANEPAPQKPIMTLPADAIRKRKEGKRAPLEQFTKQQEKKREREREVTPAREGTRTAAPVEEAPRGVPRDRRRPKGEAEAEVPDGDRDKKLAAMASSRATRQQKRRRQQVASSSEEEDQPEMRRRRRRLKRTGGINTAAPRKGRLAVILPCTLRSLSEATGVPTATIQRVLLQMGTMVTINQAIDEELAELVASELGMDVEFRQAATLEDQLVARFDAMEDVPEELQPRPPVVTFLGHVDHGKTSLLDRIMGLNVVSGEAGGITQHIRAYRLDQGGRQIAFVDTPGHEAFTEMRARGAHVTDIAVLVVAADDGVMPQTEEAISHARAAEVPIVVAMNKCDLPGADPTRVMQQLSAHELLPVEWGGEVEVVKTSAVTGEGISELLETLLLTADLREYRANPKRPATGTCLEAEQQGNQGVVAKMIVQNGTLSVGDVIVCGGAHGRVKAMYDTLNPRKKLQAVGPSTPVNLVGLDIAPQAGEAFYVLTDIAEAREIAEQRQSQSRSRSLSGRNVRVSFEEFQRRLEEGRLVDSGEVAVLNLIIRADVRGSIEAIQKELEKLHHAEVQVRILQATVGGITTADVTLADASDAVIVGFNVIPDEGARALAEDRGVEIRRYDIIYKVTEDIRAMLEGKLRPEERVAELGRALVQQTFVISRVGTVAGCRVLSGTIERGCRIRVNRNGRGIGDYPLDSLKREKDDVREAREGFECGIKLSGFNDLKEGDILEAYKIEEVARTL